MTYRQLAWTVFLIGGVWGVAGFAFDIPGRWFFLTIMVWANGIKDTGDRRQRRMLIQKQTEDMAREYDLRGLVRIYTGYR